MLKRILLITGLFMVIFGTTCFAENWVDIAGSHKQVDLDSVKTMQVGYDDIIKCTTRYPGDNYRGADIITVQLINEAQSIVCFVSTTTYDKNGNEETRIVNDPKYRKYWISYEQFDDVWSLLKTIKTNQRAN